MPERWKRELRPGRIDDLARRQPSEKTTFEEGIVARFRASVTDGVAPNADSNASSPSRTQMVVWNDERSEPRSASQFHPPSASCSLSRRSTRRSLRTPKYEPSATTRPLIHGSTSPSKKGEFPNSGPQVTRERTRSIAARARSLERVEPQVAQEYQCAHV